MVRQAFELLIEIRSKENPKAQLAQAIAFLKLLRQCSGSRSSPLVVSITAVRIRDL